MLRALRVLRVLLLSSAILALNLGESQGAIIVYEGDLTGGGTFSGQVIGDSLNDPTLYDYWSFTANAGDFITLRADRQIMDPDLVMSLFSGHATNTDEFTDMFTSTTLLFLIFGDDENPSLFGGPAADPQFSLALPATGVYTVLVSEHTDNLTAFGPFAYSITLTGAGAGPSVPEPSSMALLGIGLGLVGIGHVVRRRKSEC